MSNQIGFIGYGHMGGALLRSLLASGAIDAKEAVIYTRTKNKLAELCAKHPDIEVADSSREVAAKCKRIFICSGTYDVADIIKEISGLIDESTHLISICGGLEIQSIERIFSGKITRVIPTLVCEVFEGFSLICCNEKADEVERDWIRSVLKKVGKVKFVTEDGFEVGSTLTSCAPALLAAMLDQFGNAAVRRSGFSREEAFEMLLYTMRGTAELLIKTNENFDQLVTRVATKGGSTEQGVKVLEEHLPAVFDEMIEKALGSYPARKEKTRKQFSEAKTALETGIGGD